MKCLITGAGGMLGRDLQVVFANSSAWGKNQLDITDADRVTEAIAGHDLVINAAAYTRVDDAESDSAAAYAVNETGAKLIAQAAAKTGAKLVHLSTDYVFSGNTNQPYAEDQPHSPLSVYGRSKAGGEKAVLQAYASGSYIVRTSWLYGKHGNNFVTTMLKLAQEQETVKVVNDQHGQPTWTMDVAKQIKLLVESKAKPGIYHGTNSGQTTWFDFARRIFVLAGYDPERVLPTDSASFKRPAPRPGYSCLGHKAWAPAGLRPMRHWDEALTTAWKCGTFAA